MTNFSRRQVLSLPMAASVVGAGAAGAAYAADSNSKVNPASRQKITQSPETK